MNKYKTFFVLACLLISLNIFGAAQNKNNAQNVSLENYSTFCAIPINL
ncbi:hypothetical protein HRU45_01110 [Candidatus Dependentiae bacterium]|nr:hypothetical protein [Candidatus Dependentiae bacterium]